MKAIINLTVLLFFPQVYMCRNLSDNRMDMNRTPCPTCNSSPIAAYCETDSVFMCTECLLTHHKNCIHQVVAINKALAKASEEKAALLGRCRELQDEVTQKLSRKETLLKNHNALGEHLKTGVKHIRLTLIERINLIAMNALELTNSVMVEQTSIVDNELLKLSALKKTIDSLIYRLENRKSRDSELRTENVAVKSTITELESNLNKHCWTAGEMDIHFLVSSQVTELIETFHSLGELLVNDGDSGHRDRHSDTFQPFMQGPDLLLPELAGRLGPTPFRRSLVGSFEDQYDTNDSKVHNVFIYDSAPKPCMPHPYASLDSGPSSLQFVPLSAALRDQGGIDRSPAPLVPPRISVQPVPELSPETPEPIQVRVRLDTILPDTFSGGSKLGSQSKQSLDPMDLTDILLQVESNIEKHNRSMSATLQPSSSNNISAARSNSTSDLHRESTSNLSQESTNTSR